MKNIKPFDVRHVRAADVTPGMLTAHGVILAVRVAPGTVGPDGGPYRFMDTTSSDVLGVSDDETVQVYAQVTDAMVDTLREAHGLPLLPRRPAGRPRRTSPQPAAMTA